MKIVFFTTILCCAYLVFYAHAHNHDEDDHDDHDEEHASHVYYDWYAHSEMSAPRSDMTATVVGEAIYVLGGCGQNQQYVSKVMFSNITGLAMSSSDVQNFYEGYYCGLLEG